MRYYARRSERKEVHSREPAERNAISVPHETATCGLSAKVNCGKQPIIEDIRFFESRHGDVIRDDVAPCKRNRKSTWRGTARRDATDLGGLDGTFFEWIIRVWRQKALRFLLPHRGHVKLLGSKMSREISLRHTSKEINFFSCYSKYSLHGKNGFLRYLKI